MELSKIKNILLVVETIAIVILLFIVFKPINTPPNNDEYIDYLTQERDYYKNSNTSLIKQKELLKSSYDSLVTVRTKTKGKINKDEKFKTLSTSASADSMRIIFAESGIN